MILTVQQQVQAQVADAVRRQFGLAEVPAFAPMLLFSVTGGVISDRFDRRMVVVVTHIVSLVVGSTLAFLTIAGSVNELHVIVTAFLLQTSWTIAKPTPALSASPEPRKSSSATLAAICKNWRRTSPLPLFVSLSPAAMLTMKKLSITWSDQAPAMSV